MSSSRTIFQNVLCEVQDISWPRCSIFYTLNQGNRKLISLKTQDNLVKSPSSLLIIFKEYKSDSIIPST